MVEQQITVCTGMNFDIDTGKIETGSVCKYISDQELKEEVVSLGERNIKSAMIEAVSDR
ncbi:hypothetical protein [Haladaptatus litoreus]|uniref:hypothetical protein n=1 Tax=Haladaptatus litoreus TaxID=553468 RepID=UPI00158B51C2|nr:hypothetical protein [Haladaptatus litoreus]